MDRTWIRNRVMAVVAGMLMAAPGHAGQNVRLAETPSGNILADAVRLVAKADIALVPASTLLPDAEPANLAPAELLIRLVTGQDTVVVVRLRGSQLRSALERSVTYIGKPFAGFLQVSGVALDVDATRVAGSRVQSVLVGGTPLDLAREYRVAMPRPLADGQLGYFQFWTKDRILQDTGRTLEDAVKQLAGQSPMPRGIESRIRIRNGGKTQ